MTAVSIRQSGPHALDSRARLEIDRWWGVGRRFGCCTRRSARGKLASPARLFERYVGASPQQVAKTRRVQRAKRLIDKTNDRLARIAYRAGFGSVRRINAAFRELYGRSPSSIRHRRKVFA